MSSREKPVAGPHAHTSSDSRIFELTVHHLRDAVLLTTSDGKLLFANPAVYPLLGYSPEELIAGGLELVWEHGDIGKLFSTGDQDFAPGYSQERMRHKDGRFVPVDMHLARLSLDGRQRLLMVVRDVNRDRQCFLDPPSQARGEEGAPVMVYLTDSDWNILWANIDKAVGSGYPIQELLGQHAPLRRYLGEEEPDLLVTIERELERNSQWVGTLHSRRQNGEVYPAQAFIAAIDELNPRQTHRLVMLTDLSAIRVTERLLHQISLYDPITELPNRTLFAHEVSKWLGHANPAVHTLYLLLIDVNKFGLINEARGHETGDRVLRELAIRLRAVVGDQVLVSRNTSDTFALLAKGVKSPMGVAALVEQITEAVREPVTVDGSQFYLSVSIGISSYPEDGESFDELLRASNVALQRAKSRGGNRHAYYQRGAEAISRRYVRLAPLLHEGIGKGELTVAFQPIVETGTWRVVSMEALARWTRPDHTVFKPEDFIPVAEQSGAINEIFDVVLRCACQQLHTLDGAGFPALTSSVNVSPWQCSAPDFAERVLTIIDHEGVDHERIHLEITESLLMEEPEQNAATLAALQEQGLKVIIDDFGTGYSSFGYLKYLPVDGIKLDRIFARDVPGDSTSEKLVSMILAMGRELDIPVVAEGVETAAQARFLWCQGCSRLQGFFISRALFADSFRDFLKNGPIRLSQLDS